VANEPTVIEIEEAVEDAWQRMRMATGYLTEREARFLALLAVGSPAVGRILEIGSFKGKSTVGLATMARRFNLGQVAAVDPFSAPSSTDPDLQGEMSSYEAFRATLHRAGLESQVEVHRCLSSELASTWTDPIRLLWIDGDHTYDGAHADFTLYEPYLAPGAIVALHDALSPFEGPIRVFTEEILTSEDFGPSGFVGSIAWAQYLPGRPVNDRHARPKRVLARRAARLIPYVSPPRPLRGLARLRFRFWRSQISHVALSPEAWLRKIDRTHRAPVQRG
jgi:MMP 1-O-methyltransferase